MNYYVPKKIDIDELLSKRGIKDIRPFKLEHLLYIVHLISSIPANNKGVNVINGFVPIHAQTLQKKVRNYKQYIYYLVANEILVENKQYLPGKKSRSYKFSSIYQSPIRIVQYGKDASKLKWESSSPISKEQELKYSHLFKWFDQYLKIDKELAACYVEKEFRINSMRRCGERDGDCKDPMLQYNRSIISIEKISHRGVFFLTIDDTGFRLHSPLTNLKSELRNLLTYNNLKFVSVDINNSQPYLSTLLFNPSFWNSSHLTDVLTHDTIQMSIEDVFTNRRLFESFIMLCKKANENRMSDLHKYTELVRGGTFYESIAEYINQKGISRKEIKAAVFQVLFTDNRFIEQPDAKYKRIFREHFPDVYQMFNLLKGKDKKVLPQILQRIESHEVLLNITKRIAIEKSDLPIFTIHDSIVTIQGCEHYIVQIMEEQLAKTFGFPPKLSISYWNPENLKLSNGESFNQILCRA